MRLARLAVGVCATVALVAAGFDADAKGGRGGAGRSGGGKSGGHHSHHSHHTAASGGSGHHHPGGGYGHTTFFAVSSFVVWPHAYYWPDYHPAAVPVVEYWYYCQPHAAYYPYVLECPAEWQPVLPTAPSPDG